MYFETGREAASSPRPHDGATAGRPKATKGVGEPAWLRCAQKEKESPKRKNPPASSLRVPYDDACGHSRPKQGGHGVQRLPANLRAIPRSRPGRKRDDDRQAPPATRHAPVRSDAWQHHRFSFQDRADSLTQKNRQRVLKSIGTQYFEMTGKKVFKLSDRNRNPSLIRRAENDKTCLAPAGGGISI